MMKQMSRNHCHCLLKNHHLMPRLDSLVQCGLLLDNGSRFSMIFLWRHLHLLYTLAQNVQTFHSCSILCLHLLGNHGQNGCSLELFGSASSIETSRQASPIGSTSTVIADHSATKRATAASQTTSTTSAPTTVRGQTTAARTHVQTVAVSCDMALR